MITLRGLEKVFETNRGPVHAVQGIDLEVSENQFVVLLGPSGCGKTTTLRCVAGLERPDAGTIEIAGRVVDSATERGYVPPERRDIGMVFQSYAVWPHLNVFENVALPLTEGRQRFSREQVRERVLEALRLVRLGGLESRPVTDLSGGQQQRVALARAIVTHPKVLLMDEPLSNLDARLRDSMRTELKRLTLELGVTTLYVTHDQIEALSLGDRICVMRQGKILQQGRPEEVYNRPVDVFVAEFVGDMNFVEGTVLDHGSVETRLGRLVCQVRDDCAAGSKVTVAMRPEHVRVAGETSGQNVVEGRLLTRLFIGDAAVWQVESNGLTLAAKVPGVERTLINEQVHLYLPAEHWLVFPGQRVPAEEPTTPALAAS
jgi:iron(III) transport system ATP-binding protein